MAGRLSRDEAARYARHLVLPEVGLEGQEKIKAARVLIVGVGGLGAPAALYLAAAGVGTLGLVDHDRVDRSNLQRQVLFGEADVGRPKVEAAAERLRTLNPHVDVRAYDTRFTSANAPGLLRDHDLLVDCTDNFATRYLANDVCVLQGKPNVYASIYRFEGQASVFGAPDGPCYRCLYPRPPPPELVPSCAEGGVLGVLPGILGSIQAAEAIKLIVGRGDPLVGRLLLVDALTMDLATLKLDRSPACPVCGPEATQQGLIDYDAFCGVKGAEESGAAPEAVSVQMLVQRLAEKRVHLVDVREPHERALARIEGDARAIPLGELAARASELPLDEDIVLYCRSGVRSAKGVGILRALGFTRVQSLDGGILAWADAKEGDGARG